MVISGLHEASPQPTQGGICCADQDLARHVPAQADTGVADGLKVFLVHGMRGITETSLSDSAFMCTV